MLDTISDLPSVKLTKFFSNPYDNAVATARTCYASRIISDQEVSKDEKAIKLRDKIAQSTYIAGHHTTLQHAHFQFALAQVSRHSLWSFFHAHPFYNSEQVSQRYVTVKSGNFYIPKLANQKQISIYTSCITRQQEAYKKLVSLLHPVCEDKYFQIYPGRKKDSQNKKWQSAIKKRAQEIARYVLPVATHSHLYHTISGLTLHRYHRLAHSLDCPQEQKIIIKLMTQEVQKIDPDFFASLEDTIPLEETIEAQIFEKFKLSNIDSKNAHRLAQDFDQNLENKSSRLISYTQNPERILIQALKLALYNYNLDNQDLLKLILDPNSNTYLGESLNLLTLSKITRVLSQVSFSFNKKLSHTADSQAQRHRMLPSVKPIFTRTLNFEQPDYITPELFFDPLAKQARELYDQIQEQTLKDIISLYKDNAEPEHIQYLVTNAHPIRFCESGSLLDHLHRWTTRLCYNAQEEIWRVTRDEVLQVRACAPEIGKYLLPPCSLRLMSNHSPLCPEGDRFCGVPVWKKDVSNYQRLL